MLESQSGDAGKSWLRATWEWFRRLRLRAAVWVEHASLRRFVHWLTIALRVAVAVTGLIATSGVEPPLYLMVSVATLFAIAEFWAAGNQDLLRIERDRALEASSQASFDAAGNLRALLQILEDHEAGSLSGDRYGAALESLQRDLLTHIVNQTTMRLGLEPGQVTANWMARLDRDLRLVQNDRNHVDRSIGRTLRIDESLPGAPRAAALGDMEIVPDTHSPEVAASFDQPKPYRCILSIPVFGLAEDLIGVLNIDSKIPQSLDRPAGDNNLDVAYTVGLCEVLNRRRRSNDH